MLSVHKGTDGVMLEMKPGTLGLEVYSPRIIRIAYGLGKASPATKSFAVIGRPARARWKLLETNNEVCLRTEDLEVRVNRATGAVGFYNDRDKLILREEAAGGKSLTPTQIDGINTLRSRQSFVLAPGEAIYGLGQHQDGLMNYRGNVIHLQQRNPGESAVPVLVSSRGYGVLWANPAITDVNVGTGEEKVIPSSQLYTKNGQSCGLTARYYRGNDFNKLVATRTNAEVNFNWTVHPPPGLQHDYYSVRWTGFIEAKQGGTYTLLVSADDGARVWIDNRLVINAWDKFPHRWEAKVKFAAHSRHHVRVEYSQDVTDAFIRLAWRLPATNNLVTWTSDAADTIDYYFIYGPALDRVVADYRQLTGAVPMFGRWAWGFWQSKEHYDSQKELLDVAGKYRRLHIPIDGIIQDWRYWVPHPWGSHQFNTNRYPNPAELMRQLHAEHVHMIISVWPRFDQGNYSNYVQLRDANALYPEIVNGHQQYYDAFNPVARKIYWQQIARELFSYGIDGWWLDASEPELSTAWGEFQNYMTAAGPGFKVFNAYPLMHTTAVYQGERAETSKKRVFILTRSAYAGQQRNAAVTWSGDVHGRWSVFAKQIPAGLNFSLSGIPYWNTDTGGFFGGNPTDPAYAELFTRWFQFSAFCPMFRVHGTGDPKEMWRFPLATEKILIRYDKLRYHLLPYIYSVSWMVTHDAYTMMRPLVMDFRHDTNVYDIANQYMFGPELMVCPVTKAEAKTRNVYLPAGTRWTDFWTGRTYPGGQATNVAAPIGTLPLFVRTGSVIPYGPAVQYGMESDNPMDLRVYRGANGHFTLYEDEGDNYDYEKGKYATIPISWNEATQTLKIGQRQGNFPRMPKERTFRVVWVARGHGTGISTSKTPDVIVHYAGTALTISLAK